MKARRLRQRIEIETYTETVADTGQRGKTWAVEAERWAEVTPLSGRELEYASKINAEISHRVRLRYYDGLTSKHRIKYDGRTLEIVSVLDIDERHVEHVVMAIERV